MINLTWLGSVFRECSCVISLNQKASLFFPFSESVVPPQGQSIPSSAESQHYGIHYEWGWQTWKESKKQRGGVRETHRHTIEQCSLMSGRSSGVTAQHVFFNLSWGPDPSILSFSPSLTHKQTHTHTRLVHSEGNDSIQDKCLNIFVIFFYFYN